MARNWYRDNPEWDAEDAAEDTRPVLGCCEECGEEIHGSDDTHEADDAYNIRGALIHYDCLHKYFRDFKIQ